MPPSATSPLTSILAGNASFSAQMRETQPETLARLSLAQEPKVLWFGCSDSRVSPELGTGRGLGEMFVHRNIGATFHPEDPSALSVLTFAIGVLKVEHIVVIGHTGCGAVKAAMSTAVQESEGQKNAGPGGVLGKWLSPITSLAAAQISSTSAATADPLSNASLNELCETHVHQTVDLIVQSEPVQQAWREGQKLEVVGWIWEIEEAKVRVIEGCQKCEDHYHEHAHAE